VTKRATKTTPTAPGTRNSSNGSPVKNCARTTPKTGAICVAKLDSPATRPRCDSGSRSACEMPRLLYVVPQPHCARIQPNPRTRTLGASAITMSETTPTSVPPTRKGRRRPKRVRVRSLQIPMKGEVSMTKSAPAPVMSPRYSGCPGASTLTRIVSEIASGVMKAMKTPNWASVMNQT
jgi:hypothetical protein